jgi:formylmethanofuran dehydrogenase subunit E
VVEMDIRTLEVKKQDEGWARCDECGNYFFEGEKAVDILFGDWRIILCKNCFENFLKKLNDFTGSD